MLPFTIQLKPGTPAYEQVVYATKRAIASGQLAAGDAFPSIRALSKELKINPNTAQKVVTQLKSEGLLVVMPGIGTVVAEGASTSRQQAESALQPRLEQLVVEARQMDLDCDTLLHLVQREWQTTISNQKKK